MSEGEKKTRRMSVKRFVKGPSVASKMTAEGFLAAHRQWLDTHSFLSPILEAYDAEQLLPTPTLQAVKSALVDHVLMQETAKGLARMQEMEDTEEQPGEQDPYTITLMVKGVDAALDVDFAEVGTYEEVLEYQILTDSGPQWVGHKDSTEGYHVMSKETKIHQCVWGAKTFGEAQRLADRRLLEREDSVYAVIQNTQGVPIKTKVPRGDAVYRMLRSPKGAVSKGGKKTTPSLKFQGRAKQDRASFSRG